MKKKIHVVMFLAERVAIYTDSDMKYINRRCRQNAEFLGEITKLRKGTVSSDMFICLSACTRLPVDKLSRNSVFECFENFMKIHVSWKYDKHNGYFTGRPTYIYDNTALTSSQNEKCFRQSWRENQNTPFMFNNFFFRKSCRLWENVKNIIQPDRP
jgi:hypothetical protein